MRLNSNKQAGFSLVELMVVVGIIGILAALAVPRLQTFSAKAKVSEGRAVINNMATLQQAFYAENSVYQAAGMNDVAAYTALGYNRPVAAGQYYNNPSVTIGANVFTATSNTALALCNGVPAAFAAATININQAAQIGFGAAPAAGNVPALRTPSFVCN